ncbi:hypothetical protein [Puia dinghuensis]|uniref:Uncharacterized protein n=1 Tax=Puia dinghuensis TaxID=1792502 RepID=A0A8J2XWX4_9BACT|nr:hypothetical protein [Puia dinghuensis]GGB22968.1 hypothetical protein GCM10011511_53620 [Puia dinghuensis]
MNTFTLSRLRQWALASLALLLLAACRKETSTPTAPPSTDLVLTPAGYMPRSSVHYIGPGYHLSVEKGRLQKMESRTGRMIEDFGPVTITPAHHSREVQGWIAYAFWNNTGTAITSFTTDWVVPSTPANQGSQTLFLFNGMQDGTTRTSYIIQPVLQWGPSAAGGGKFWAVTNWYVSSSQAFFGSLVTVSPGASLQGVMKETAVSGSNYSYNSSFTGYPSASALQVNNVPQAFWAAETLESYGVTSPGTMYPPDADIAMNSIQILQGAANASISWTPVQAVSGSAQRAVVVSDASPGGEVDIYFR